MKTLRFLHTTDYSNPLSYTEVFPLSSKEFEDKKEKNEVFYRRKSSGKYTFVNDRSKNILDFDFFYSIEQDMLERCRSRYIIVEELCNGVWSEYHIGKFSMNDGDWDLDKCRVEIKVTELDRYSCIKENKDNDFNILTVAPIISTTAPRDTPYEFVCARPCDLSLAYSGPNPATWRTFYEECTTNIPGTGVVVLETNTNYPPTVGSNSMIYAGDYYFYISNFQTVPDRFTFSRFEIATNTETSVGIGNQIQIAAANNVGLWADRPISDVVIKKTDLVTNTTIATYTILGVTLKTLDIALTHSISVVNNGAQDIIRMDSTIIATSNLITNVATSNSGFSYFDSSLGQYRFYRFSDASNNIIQTGLLVGSITDAQMNDDYLVYEDNLNNELVKVELATLTATQVRPNVVSRYVLSDSFIAYRDGGELILHELATGIETIVVPASANDVFDVTDIYLSYHIGGNVRYYDIVGATDSLATAGTPVVIRIDGNNILFHSNILFSDFNIVTGLVEFTKVIAGASQDMDCGSGSVGFIENGAPDKYWFYKVAILNTTKVKIWYREVRTTLCVGGVPNSPTGSGWVVEENNCGTVGTTKWVRFPNAITPTIQIQPGICDGAVCEPTPPTLSGQWLLVCGCTCADPRAFYWLLPEDITYDRGRLLKDVIEGMLSEFCPDINGIISNFFQWNPTDVSDINYVTGEVSEVNHITIHQKSDVRSPNSSEPAWIGNLKWKDLVENLRIMFEVYYYIDNNDTMHFEHISAIQNNIGLNLTQGKFYRWQKNNRQYSYQKSEMFKLERFKFAEQENIDNVGYEIEYKDVNGNFSLCVNDEEKEYTATKWTTDLILAQNNPSALDRNGFFLMANTFDGISYRVISGIGVITGQLIINSPLGWSNLQENYLKWNRILLEGVVNRVFQPLNSAQRFKEQKKFKIPLCCEDNYNPVDFMITELGIAQVQTGVRDFKNNTLEIKLTYE